MTTELTNETKTAEPKFLIYVRYTIVGIVILMILRGLLCSAFNICI